MRYIFLTCFRNSVKLFLGSVFLFSILLPVCGQEEEQNPRTILKQSYDRIASLESVTLKSNRIRQISFPKGQERNRVTRTSRRTGKYLLQKPYQYIRTQDTERIGDQKRQNTTEAVLLRQKDKPELFFRRNESGQWYSHKHIFGMSELPLNPEKTSPRAFFPIDRLLSDAVQVNLVGTEIAGGISCYKITFTAHKEKFLSEIRKRAEKLSPPGATIKEERAQKKLLSGTWFIRRDSLLPYKGSYSQDVGVTVNNEGREVKGSFHIEKTVKFTDISATTVPKRFRRVLKRKTSADAEGPDKTVFLRGSSRLQVRVFAPDGENPMRQWTGIFERPRSPLGRPFEVKSDRSVHEFREMASGMYKIRVRAEGYAVSSPRTVQLQSGKTKKVKIELVRGSRLKGTVKEPDGGGPVENVEVQERYGTTVETDSDGKFQYENWSGKPLIVNHSSYPRTMVPVEEITTSQTMAPGMGKDITITLEQGIKLSGQIRGNIPEKMKTIALLGSSGFRRTSRLNDDYSFSFDTVSPGEYRLVLNPEALHVFANADQAIQRSVRVRSNGSDKQDVDWKLPEADQNITLQLETASGAIANTLVSIANIEEETEKNNIYFKSTNREGEVRFSDKKPGMYLLQLYGRPMVSYLVQVKSEGEFSSKITPGSHSVNGKVLNPEGKPIERKVRLTLSRANVGNKELLRKNLKQKDVALYNCSMVSFTSDGGKFTFSNLPPGRYTLYAEVPGYYAEEKLHLSVNQQKRDLVVRLVEANCSMEGMVLTQDGKPLNKAKVYLVNKAEKSVLLSKKVETDRQGRFDISSLPAGEYDVIVQSKSGTGNKIGPLNVSTERMDPFILEFDPEEKSKLGKKD